MGWIRLMIILLIAVVDRMQRIRFRRLPLLFGRLPRPLRRLPSVRLCVRGPDPGHRCFVRRGRKLRHIAAHGRAAFFAEARTVCIGMTAFFAKHVISPFRELRSGRQKRPSAYLYCSESWCKSQSFLSIKDFSRRMRFVKCSEIDVLRHDKSSLAKGSFCCQQENFCLTCSILGRSTCCAGYQPFSCIFS